ncbi:MAG: hypothetical protein RLZ55_673 [Actinomycetota bacterium]
MLTLLGVLVFIVGIMASIALHEVGHMVPAKKFGVKVTEYFIGFGPTVWSKRKGETDYGVKAIPLGGYVRMIGMFPPRADGTIRKSSTGRLGMLVDQARNESESEVLTDDDRKRTFYNLTVPKKLVVMFGGPVMNLILALILFGVMFVGFGTPGPSLTVNSVSECLPAAAADDGSCPAGAPSSAAARAGVKEKDEIIALGATPVGTWDDFTAALTAQGAGTTTVTVMRDGQEVILPVALDMVERPVIVDGKVTEQTVMRPFLGVGPTFVLTPIPVTSVPGEVWGLTVRSAQALVAFPAKLVGVADAAFGDAQRDPDGPIGMVGAGRISGDIAGADLPGSWKIAQLIGLIASINLFLFLFNLIPLLPLDGGHIAGALYEGARRQVAKVRHKPDPGPVDVAKALPIAYAVSGLLIVVSLLLVYADIVAPVKVT